MQTSNNTISSVNVIEIVGNVIVEALTHICTAAFYVTFAPVLILAWTAYWLEGDGAMESPTESND